MDENVPAFFGQPILIRTSTMWVLTQITHKQLQFRIFPLNFSYRFTQIVVDAQIKTPGGKTYDVIFVGTGKSICYKLNSLPNYETNENSMRIFDELCDFPHNTKCMDFIDGHAGITQKPVASHCWVSVWPLVTFRCPILFVLLFSFLCEFVSSGGVTHSANKAGRLTTKENRCKVFHCSLSPELLLCSNSTINWKTCLFYDCINFSFFPIVCVRSCSCCIFTFGIHRFLERISYVFMDCEPGASDRPVFYRFSHSFFQISYSFLRRCVYCNFQERLS